MPRAKTNNTGTKAYRDAEAHAGYVAVCIIGTGVRVPRTFNDNEGAHPMRVVLTAERNPMKAAVTAYNKGAHTHLYQTLCYGWAESAAHAERIKARLIDKIFGQGKAAEMLSGFADCEGWVAELLLGETVAELDFELFGQASKEQRIRAAMLGRIGKGR